jgi:hypothetical protein
VNATSGATAPGARVPAQVAAPLDRLAAVDAQAAAPPGSEIVAVEAAAGPAARPQAANGPDGLVCVERQAVAPAGRDRAPAPPGTATGVDGLPVPAAPAGTEPAADNVRVNATANSIPRMRIGRR